MADDLPVVDEFGPGATTCSGDFTGCAVCTCASILLRYGKPIPRLANGTPDMRTLGNSMGLRHRKQGGVRHGLSLQGQCSPPSTGTNWCAYCIFLELDARGVYVGYAQLSDTQILAHLRARHSLAVPGLYSKIPLISEGSYTAKTVARGRSDSQFGGWHMVGVHGVIQTSTGVPTRVKVTDSDFGSTSRPVVPANSEWSWTAFKNFYHAASWGITYTTRAPAAIVPPPPPLGSKTVHFAHGAKIRVYTKLHPNPKGSGPGCIDNDTSTWHDSVWTGSASSTSCTPTVHRDTCDGKSGATTTKVLNGHYAGMHVRVGAEWGVTVT